MKSLVNRFQFLKPYGIIMLLINMTFIPAIAQSTTSLSEKKITLHLTNVPVTDVLSALEDKAGCTFSYSSNQLNNIKPVSVQYDNISLEEALSRLLGERLGQVRINGNQVFIQMRNSQKGIVKGVVSSSDGKPAEGVTVRAEHTNYATQTSSDGRYELRLPVGDYELIISFIGLSPQSERITVVAGESIRRDFTLSQNSKALQEITVTGNHINKFGNKQTETPARMPLNNLENPQVYNVVSKELAQEQLVTDFKSMFRNVPGASASGNAHSSNGRYMNVMRGFNQGSPARNGLASPAVTEIDPANLERIEAIKGPSGTLFGAGLSSFGGIVNRVTKRAFSSFKGEVGYTAGSWGLSRLTADVNTPLDSARTFLFRVNTAVHNERSFQDQGFSKTMLFAPTFTYQPSPRLSITLDAEFYSRKGTNIYGNSIPAAAIASGVVTAKSVDQLGLDYDKSFTNNSIRASTQTRNIFAEVNYKISDQWLSRTNVSTGLVEFEFPALTLTTINDSMLIRVVNYQFTRQNPLQIQQNFIGDFYIGDMRNRTVLGFDYYSIPYEFPFVQRTNYDTVNYRTINTKYSNISYDDIKRKIAGVMNSGSSANSNYLGAYVSNVTNLLNDHLLLMLSLRIDRFKDLGGYNFSNNQTTEGYHQTALSPKLGLVYQIIKEQVSLFANYMNGYSYLNGLDFNNNRFKPQYANQAEGGIKFSLAGDKITGTISYYDISVTNSTRLDPDHPGFSIQDGTQKSKGVDMDFVASPVAGLNIVAGYAYNDSKLTRANKDVEGLRPAGSGAVHTGNLWLSYRLTHGAVNGLGLGFGGNYTGEQFIVNSTTARFVIPSYTILDASLFYDRPKYRIAVKVDNMTSEKYWSTGLAPQAPARVSANLTVKFR